MALRMSSLFLRTLREDPADAEVPSHRLLVRAGYIRRVSPGHLHLAAARPEGAAQRRADRPRGDGRHRRPGAALPGAAARASPTRRRGRWTEYGDNIFRLKDRKGADYLLGPTHEEMFTLAVKDLYSSYKDLPLSIYQIQTKYRDEARPRAGRAARARVRHEGLLLLRHRRRRARQEPTSCTARPTSASSTGSASTTSSSQAMAGRHGRLASREEFLATAENGEDTYVRCTKLRLRRQRRGRAGAGPRRRRPYDGVPAAHVEDTPDTPTIETLVAPPQRARSRGEDRPWAAGDTLKNVLVMLVHPDGTREPLAIGVPGDREVDEKRLERPGRAGRGRGVRRGRLRGQPGAGQGLHRPRRARRGGHAPASATCSTPGSSRAPAGSPAPTSRAGTSSTSSPAATSPPTAPSRPPRCAPATPARAAARRVLETARGIEMGHIFQLGTKYAEALGLKVLDQNGKLRHRRPWAPTASASRRAVAAVAEGNHDEVGLVWPRELAPPTCTSSPPARTRTSSTTAEEIDRASSRRRASACCTTTAARSAPGVKFKDAELIGVPTIVVRRARPGRGHRSRSRTAAPARRDVAVARPSTRSSPRSSAPARPDGRQGAGAACREPLRAVIFDWGGTLTPWHTVDMAEQWRVFARTARCHEDRGARRRAELAARILAGRGPGVAPGPRPGRAAPTSTTSARGGRRPGTTAHEPALAAYRRFWEPHTFTDPQVRPLWEGLRERGIRVGRAVQHDLDRASTTASVFERDGVLDLLDADVYSSEIALDVKPHPEAFRAAAGALGVEPGAAVVRRRPAVRGRARPPAGRACAPSGCRTREIPAAQQVSRRRRRPTPWPTSCSTSSTSSTAGRGAGEPTRAPRPLAAAHGSAGLAAGWVDAVVGGGGLIQLPALLLGLPGAAPAQLLATNKFGSICGTVGQLGHLLPPGAARPAHGRCRWRWSPSSGALGGALIGLHIPKAAFNPILLVVLVVVGAYTLLRPELGPRDRAAVRGAPPHRWRRCGAGFVIGVYDGALGPGHRLLLRLRPRRADGLRVPRGQRQGQDRQLRDEPRPPWSSSSRRAR